MIADDGRIALIDYGNCPTLSSAERVSIAKLIVALDNRDDEAILDAFREIGYAIKGEGENADGPLARKLLLMSAYGDFDQQYGTPFFNEHFGYPADMSLSELMSRMEEEMSQASIAVDAPANIINLQRCVMTLNSVATATGAGNVRPSGKFSFFFSFLLSQLTLFSNVAS